MEAEPAKGEIAAAAGEEGSDTDAGEEAKTTAGKKANVALSSAGVAPLLRAIDGAESEVAVEEILTQLIQQLSDKGKSYTKKAMTDLIRGSS